MLANGQLTYIIFDHQSLDYDKRAFTSVIKKELRVNISYSYTQIFFF